MLSADHRSSPAQSCCTDAGTLRPRVPLALRPLKCGKGLNGRRGIRASLRERSLGALWDGSQTLCCLIGKSGSGLLPGIDRDCAAWIKAVPRVAASCRPRFAFAGPARRARTQKARRNARRSPRKSIFEIPTAATCGTTRGTDRDAVAAAAAGPTRRARTPPEPTPRARRDDVARRPTMAPQYLVLHLEHCFARRGSGAAQAAQFVRIIFVGEAFVRLARRRGGESMLF